MNDIHAFFFQFPNRNTIFIQRDFCILYLHIFINPGNFMIARILYSIDPVISKKLYQKSMQIFCPRSDDDLFRLDLHGTELL